MPEKPVRVALDSSYLIALISDWHGQHARTLRSYMRWLEEHAEILLPLHAVAESFSVLTRLPLPYRLSAQLAQQSLSENFAKHAIVVGLQPQRFWRVMEGLARLGISGGQVYNALIAASASEAHASVLMTWNPKHFIPVTPADLEVRQPE